MSVKMIQDRLESYRCRSATEEEQALREITQEVVLAALGRTDFFKKAAFQGGTCLRIFYGTNRFSEDLDFALREMEPSFALGPYLGILAKDLEAYGCDLEVEDRTKLDQMVRKAFLKDESLGRLLRLKYKPTTGPLRKMRIKLEVDVNPPPGAIFEIKYLDFPFPSAVCLFDPPSLFAGKLHALLCRGYLKGRDWYDFIWYTSRRTPANYALLSSALEQNGPWKGRHVAADRDWCVEHLRRRVDEMDWRQAAEDVRRFLKPGELPSLELWGKDLFLAQCEKLR